MSRTQQNQIIAELVEGDESQSDLDEFKTYLSGFQYRRLYDLLERYVPQGARILDWGTGRGHFAYYLARAGYRSCGYSFNGYPDACRRLEDGEYTHYAGTPADPVSLPFEDEEFDAVFSVGVLEHVRDCGGNELASLREIYRVLEPGGVFVCYHFPNHLSWIEWVARRTARFSHNFLYSPAEVRELLQQTDFALLESGRYGILPRNLWNSSLLKHRRMGPFVGAVYDRADLVFGMLLPWFCQNHYFVVKKAEV